MKALILTLSVLFSVSLAAQTTSVSSELKNNAIVVLQDFQGEVVVKNWDSKSVKVVSEAVTTMKVYKTDMEVYISATDEKSNNKNAKYIVYLPKNVKLDWYSQSSNLTVKGQFFAVNIENANGSTKVEIPEETTEVLSASIQ